MFTFRKRYFIIALALFVTEVLIALFVTDKIIRPYVGDLLVVILIYCFIKSFLNLPVMPVAIFVLAFSFTIEFLQYLHIVDKLGLRKSKIASVAIGTLFEWIDLVAYTMGIAVVVIVEKYTARKNKVSQSR